MVLGTASGQATAAHGNLASADGRVTRRRLEANRLLQLSSGATLTPSLETGRPHDGGDAETGFGLSFPEQGLAAGLRGRGLLSHTAARFQDRGFPGSLAWQQPDSHRGAPLPLTQTINGGMDALLNRTTLEGLAANHAVGNDHLKNQQMEIQLSYGLHTISNRFTLTPELGLGLYDSAREYPIGWHLTRLDHVGSLALSCDATRRENANGDGTTPEHGVQLGLNMRFWVRGAPGGSGGWATTGADRSGLGSAADAAQEAERIGQVEGC